LVVGAALMHTGAARVLVHRLKYQGLVAAAGPLVEAMAPLLDPIPPALVPVPRALARRWRYGVDPGPELAAALGELMGVPVVAALRPAWWYRSRAGGRSSPRGSPRFTAARPIPPGSVLVDDVVTTGSTLSYAAAALGGVGGAVTATAAPSLALHRSRAPR
jgi:predicted amidophosphoribosyltransferase